MQFTPYTLAMSDLVLSGIVLTLVNVSLVLFGRRLSAFFDPLTPEQIEILREADRLTGLARHHLEDPLDAGRFELPDLAETGIAAEIAGLAPGSMLVECDTAGMLTPPERLLVHVYRWTGSRIEFEKTVPLHELDFVVPPPPSSAAEIRAGMLDAVPASPLRLVPSGAPIGRPVSEF